jgi:hypothetical protein
LIVKLAKDFFHGELVARKTHVLTGLVSVSFDEGADDGVDFFCFFDPAHPKFSGNESGFYSNLDLSNEFAAGALCNGQESSNLCITVSFQAFSNVRRHG